MLSIEILRLDVWSTASLHTHPTDAQEQWDRFLATGIDSTILRKVGW